MEGTQLDPEQGYSLVPIREVEQRKLVMIIGAMPQTNILLHSLPPNSQYFFTAIFPVTDANGGSIPVPIAKLTPAPPHTHTTHIIKHTSREIIPRGQFNRMLYKETVLKLNSTIYS